MAGADVRLKGSMAALEERSCSPVLVLLHLVQELTIVAPELELVSHNSGF